MAEGSDASQLFSDQQPAAFTTGEFFTQIENDSGSEEQPPAEDAQEKSLAANSHPNDILESIISAAKLHTNSPPKKYEVPKPVVMSHAMITSRHDFWARAQINIAGKFIPSGFSKDKTRLGLTMYRRGGVRNARVSLVATFNNADGELCHTATLDWHLDVKPYFRKIEIVKETLRKINPDEGVTGAGDIHVKCNFFGKAATINVFKRDSEWSTPDANALLTWMADLRFADDNRIVEMKFSFPDTEKHDELMKIIHSLGQPGHMPFSPFRSKKTGHPVIQYGLIRGIDDLAKRKYDNSDDQYDFAMYPAKDTFRDINEYVIHHAYGEYQEWVYQRSLFENWKQGEHECSFVILQNDVVLVKINVNGVKLDKLHTTNHVTFQVFFTPAGIENIQGIQQVKAVVQEDVFHIAGPNQLVLLVVNKTAKHFKGISSVYPAQNGPTFSCTVSAEFDDSHISLQLDALSKMVSSQTRWNQLFVNEDACIKPRENPSLLIEGSSLAASVKVFQEEVARAGLNDGQKAAAAISCFSHTAGAAAIKAAAGTGKTKVSSVIASYFLRIGAHVLCIATSNPAADAIYAGIDAQMDPELLRRLGPSCKPIRFHAWVQEKSDLRFYGKGETPIPPKNAYQHAEDAKYNENAVNFALEIAMYTQERRKTKSRSFARPETGLCHLVLEEADRGTMKVMSRYPASQRGTNGKEAKVEIDMMEELRKFKVKLMNTPLRKWTEQDRRNFSFAFECCAEHVLGSKKCVVTTPIMVTRKVIGKYAAQSKGVIVILEEAAMARDSLLAVALLSPKWASKIRGIILVGDTEQNDTLVMSMREFGAFGRVIQRPLFDRLEASGFPIARLTEQYRCRPQLLEFPNKRAYNGMLTTAEAVLNRPGNEVFDRFLVTYTGSKDIDAARLQFIDVPGSECVISDFTRSRTCLKTAVWARDFVIQILTQIPRDRFNVADELLFLCPYQDQLKLTQHHLRKALQLLNKGRKEDEHFTVADLPEVATVDSYQGKEKTFIISLITVTEGREYKDLGFLTSDKRINMMCTRSKEYFWIVGNINLPHGILFSTFSHTYLYEKATEGKAPKKMPYIAEYTRQMISDDRVATVEVEPTEEDKAEHQKWTVRPQEEAVKDTKTLPNLSFATRYAVKLDQPVEHNDFTDADAATPRSTQDWDGAGADLPDSTWDTAGTRKKPVVRKHGDEWKESPEEKDVGPPSW